MCTLCAIPKVNRVCHLGDHMSTKEKAPQQNAEPITINESIRSFFGEQIPMTCSLREAAKITGLSYEYLLACSKTNVRGRRVPGFKPGNRDYRVLISGLTEWIEGMCK